MLSTVAQLHGIERRSGNFFFPLCETDLKCEKINENSRIGFRPRVTFICFTCGKSLLIAMSY